MSTSKVVQVALRDLLATVTTRGFVIGLLLMPSIMAVGFLVVPKLMAQRGRPLEGAVLVIDDTGRVGDDVARAFSPGAIAARQRDTARQVNAALPEGVRESATDAAVRFQGDGPLLTIEQQPGPFSMDRARPWLFDGAARPAHLAVVAIGGDALERSSSSGEYGGYRVYLPPNADGRVDGALYDGMRTALVAARTRARGIDAADLQAVVRVPRPQSMTVSADGERATNVAFARALPYVFTALLFMTIMMGGQGLMTTTIEEKQSRVVEVLLSAVSPLELMTGKLLAQLAVGLIVMAVYVALGMMVLTSFAMLGLLDLSLIGYLLAFFAVSYLMIGSAMIAMGAAVNELREAQSLMTPVTVVLILPWVLAAPILQNPSSPFAVALSFVPPVNTFAMLLRLTSSTPPPTWQPLLSLAVAAAAASGALWCAAKVYRIGLLMYGKPPDFATLVRWVRAA